jgi:putative ABC transport system substrate-binding protein
LPAFRDGLKEAGYIEEQNLTVEYRWAGGQYDRLPALAADLVGRKVAVIFTTSNAATQAAKAATETTPIVFAIGGDPVSLGLVASMKEPGGNLTGASFLRTATRAINLQMLHEAVPNASIVGALINPANPNAEPNKRLCPAYPGNPRSRIEGESPPDRKGHTACDAQHTAQRVVMW